MFYPNMTDNINQSTYKNNLNNKGDFYYDKHNEHND